MIKEEEDYQSLRGAVERGSTNLKFKEGASVGAGKKE